MLGIGGSQNMAMVRLVNATAVPLDITSSGVVPTGGGNIASNSSSSCVRVDATIPNLAVRQTGTTSNLPGLVPNFVRDASFTIVAYPVSNGTIQFASVPSSFTPAAGQSGLRLFDGAPTTGSFDVYVTPPGAPMVTPSASNLGFGSATSFLTVAAGTNQTRFTNVATTVVAFDAGSRAFTAGQSQIFVLSAPRGTLGSIVVPSC
jgi:hypothetical protein